VKKGNLPRSSRDLSFFRIHNHVTALAELPVKPKNISSLQRTSTAAWASKPLSCMCAMQSTIVGHALVLFIV
jgi:hypothetical protein